MASHSDPKWCCASSLTKTVTFFAVPFWSIPTPPAVLHQLSFFDRCADFLPFVGLAIAFCGLSCLGISAAARQTTKTDRLSHYNPRTAIEQPCPSIHPSAGGLPSRHPTARY